MWATIVELVLGALVKIGLRKKDKSDAERARAAEKVLEGVGESIDKEREIRDAQDDVDKKPSKVEGDDGGLNFDSFNSGG